MQITRHKNTVILVECKFITDFTLICLKNLLKEYYNNCLRTIQEDAVLEALCEMTNIETEKALKLDKAWIIGHFYDKIIISLR